MKINDFKLERFFAKYEFTTPYNLCASDCESFTIEELFQMDPSAESHFKKLYLGYTESLGGLELREEITSIYESIKTEDLLVFSGAQEAIFILMNVLLEKGDNVIVQYPAYQSLYEVAIAIGCDVTKWEMKDSSDGWKLDIMKLKKSIKPTTKLIVVNFPHNPTGYLPSLQEYQEIVSTARENDIFLFCDEVYKFLEYKKGTTLPAACDLYEKGISAGVLSKTYGLAGLRIGWLALKDRDLYQQISSYKDYTTICCSAPSEFLATLALQNKEKITKRNLSIIKSNLEHISKFFSKYSDIFECSWPMAGSIMFPKIKIQKDIKLLCEDIAEKAGVLLLPGDLFDYDNKHFRMGFGRKNLPEVLGKLEDYIKENYDDLT
ncbi:MAG: aminotransferase class I/II-fold pyridoxal phosphate-dependent enzyme [archaeon]|nr:aminotransferase class I/II-fold pyridoxal phosphate-dependent enzyme [archaeon]